ncbi:MAG: 30S ribosomal protein S16 [Patescibacteria group bacterium]
MLTIRLARYGRKKQPTYRLIISENTKDTKGNYLEQLGFYNPRTEPSTINLKTDRIKYWISKGAQTSDTVHNLLVDQGVIDAPKHRKGRIDKKPSKKARDEEAKAESKAPAEAVKKEEPPKESPLPEASEDKKEVKEEVKKPELAKEEVKSEDGPKEENKEKSKESADEKPTEEAKKNS